MGKSVQDSQNARKSLSTHSNVAS